MKIHAKHFNSLGELIEYIHTNEPDERLGRQEAMSSRSKTDASWTGSYTWEDCLSLVTNGWPEGRAIAQKYTTEYGKIWQRFFPQADYANDFKPDIAGAIPMVDKVIEGNPENMLEFFPNENLLDKLAGNKLQRMIVNCRCSCRINIETILQRGSLIAALVNSMELAGFNIELNLVWQATGNSNHVQLHTLIVKNFSDILDIDKVAFCVAHSSMLRRIIFAAEEIAPYDFANSFIGHGYGYPTNLDTTQITSFGADILGGELGGKKTNMYFKKLDSNYTLDALANQCTAVVKEHFTEVNFNYQEDNNDAQQGRNSSSKQ